MTATVVDLTSRRLRGELAVARVAAAPVRHVPPAFLAALACTDEAAPTLHTCERTLRLAR